MKMDYIETLRVAKSLGMGVDKFFVRGNTLYKRADEPYEYLGRVFTDIENYKDNINDDDIKPLEFNKDIKTIGDINYYLNRLEWLAIDKYLEVDYDDLYIGEPLYDKDDIIEASKDYELEYFNDNGDLLEEYQDGATAEFCWRDEEIDWLLGKGALDDFELDWNRIDEVLTKEYGKDYFKDLVTTVYKYDLFI